MRQFEADSAEMAKSGYIPVSQYYTPGQYGCGSFLVALVLCFVLIGFLVFLYMLIVKPDGSLTVTYEYRLGEENVNPGGEKVCPRCAENVKAAAKVCRFCGHEFGAS